MAGVLLQNISKQFPGGKGRALAVVDDLNLEVRDGEFMVFVGPSGCGKSTTLRMIAGLEEITRGDIFIDGRRVNEVPPKDRDIAMVFQNYALYPHLTVYKNMAFGLELRKFPRAEIERRVREAAQILGLTDDMLARLPKALSGGQRQRVALGRAIVRKPKVFLFDEPLSNLDAKMRVQMRAEISKLHRRLNTTMIYVTHDQVEAMTMGDRICLMKDGRIQQVAAPLEIYHRPANMYVAAFIGSPPMNFFAGTLVEREGHLYFLGEVEGKRAFPRLLAIDPFQQKELASRLDQKIHLGLRPEDFHFPEDAPSTPNDSVLEATLDVVEPMGAETFFHCTIGPHAFIVRSAVHRQGKPGDPIRLIARMDKAHFFQTTEPDAFRTETGEINLEKWQTACPLIL